MSTVAGVDRPRRAFLDEVMPLLWPPPATTSHERAGRTHGAQSYVVLPGARDPRVVLPLPSPAVGARMLRGFTPGSRRGRAAYQAASWAAALGLGGLHPYRIVVQGPPPGPTGIEDHLAACLGREVHAGFRVGAPRANSKVVLQLFSADGETLAYAKLGINDLTDMLVRQEATALGTLAARSLRRLVVPDLVHVGTWQRHALLVTRPLGSKAQPGAAELVAAMLEVAEVGARGPVPACETPYWARLHGRVAGLPESGMARWLRELLAALDRHATAAPGIRTGSWHGDWTPWNTGALGNRVTAWDWERFETGVPWGYDALHHGFNSMLAQDRLRPEEAARTMLVSAPVLLEPFADDPADARFTALAYLVEIATRYLHDDLLGSGGRLGDLTTWLLPVLADAVRAGQR